jgi:hypothetical protein
MVVALLVPGAPAFADDAGGLPVLTLTPAALSVTKGAAVSLTLQVDGPTAPRQVSYVVVGRNDGVHGTVTTGDDGIATIGYRDRGSDSNLTSDTIAVIDGVDDQSATATVDYLDGPDYASTLALDTSGLGVTDTSCDAANSAPATDVRLARQTLICALVGNALGEPLAGKPVTFAVSVGSVGPVTATTPATTSTYQALTDRAGVAFAVVSATVPGLQQVTAAADHLASGDAVDYAPPAPEDAAAISIASSTDGISAGKARRFVATVLDGYGNPVPGVQVGFEVSGVGSLAGPAEKAATGPAGSLTAVVTTQHTDRGAGTLTATVLSLPAQCTTLSRCSASTGYTVSKPLVPASLTLEAAPGSQVGAVELVAAVVTASDGSPSPGQVVHFGVSGADTTSGIVRSNAKGVALFGYAPQRRGTDTVRALGRHQPRWPLAAKGAGWLAPSAGEGRARSRAPEKIVRNGHPNCQALRQVRPYDVPS